jgi:hypothetical protein
MTSPLTARRHESCALWGEQRDCRSRGAERGGLNAPDIYMDKIVVGPSCQGAIDIDAPVKQT